MNQRTDSTELERKSFDTGFESDVTAGPRSYTAYQANLLEKLERMRRNREEYSFRPDAEEWILKASDRAIYSAFLDCLTEGIGREAKSILSSESGVGE